MKLEIQVEQCGAENFRASIGNPWDARFEATSREEAIAGLKQLIEERATRTEVVEIDVDVPTAPHPWAAICGSWRDHPDQAEFEANIREYRQQIELGQSRT